VAICSIEGIVGRSTLAGWKRSTRTKVRLLAPFAAWKVSGYRLVANALRDRPAQTLVKTALAYNALNLLFSGHNAWDNQPQNVGRIETGTKRPEGTIEAFSWGGPLDQAIRASGVMDVLARAEARGGVDKTDVDYWWRTLVPHVKDAVLAQTHQWVQVAIDTAARNRAAPLDMPSFKKAGSEMAGAVAWPARPILERRTGPGERPESGWRTAGKVIGEYFGTPTPRAYKRGPFGGTRVLERDVRRETKRQVQEGWRTPARASEALRERGQMPLSKRERKGMLLHTRTPQRVREAKQAKRVPVLRLLRTRERMAEAEEE